MAAKKKAKKKGKKRAASRATTPKRKKAKRAAPRPNPKKKAKRAPKKKAAPRPKAKAPKKRKNRAVLSPRWYERILASPAAQRLDRMGAAGDQVQNKRAWFRQPPRERAAIVVAMFRKGGRARRGAVALARAEQRHTEGPPARRNPGFSDAEAERQYRKKHWGLPGRRAVRAGGAPDPSSGTAVKLGELRSVTYRTTKRGDGLSDYEHEFEGRRPVLAFNKGGLLIVGGDYTVEDEGITG